MNKTLNCAHLQYCADHGVMFKTHCVVDLFFKRFEEDAKKKQPVSHVSGMMLLRLLDRPLLCLAKALFLNVATVSRFPSFVFGTVSSDGLRI